MQVSIPPEGYGKPEGLAKSRRRKDKQRGERKGQAGKRPTTSRSPQGGARLVGIVMAADPVVPTESATVKVMVLVFWSNVSPETDELELTEME